MSKCETYLKPKETMNKGNQITYKFGTYKVIINTFFRDGLEFQEVQAFNGDAFLHRMDWSLGMTREEALDYVDFVKSFNFLQTY
jgi:hypothetical protein